MDDNSLVLCEVYCVRFDIFNKIPVVLLKDTVNQRFLPIWIGVFEATQIEIALENVPVERPMTHDLMKSIIDRYELNLEEIQIHSIVNGTFHARLLIREKNGQLSEVDARPSDAIALSLRTETPIYVAAHIIEEAAIVGKTPDELDSKKKDDEDEAKKFKDFLSNLKPDDFKN